jgi:hypothetical protein
VAQRGHRIYGTTSVRVSTTIQAPLRYVYEWCTDYRTDDWRLGRRGGAKSQFRVLRISPHRVIRLRVTPSGSGDPWIAVEEVRLDPPAHWHMDQIDEGDIQTVDYRLTRIGARTTRLVLHTTERWLTRQHPSPKELRQAVSNTWNRFARALEVRYRKRLPARGR